MTEPNNNSEDWSLHAYADGEIAGPDARALDERLAADPEARAKVEAWRRQISWLKEAFDPVLSETVPPKIKAALRNRFSRIEVIDPFGERPCRASDRLYFVCQR